MASSLVWLAHGAFSYAKDRAVNVGYGPVTLLAKTAIIGMMQRITVGQLRVLTSDGIYTFPPPASTIEDFQVEGDIYNGGPKAELRVLNETFWVRLVLLGDLGFSEGYMAGDVECDDLAALFRIFILNRPKENSSSSVSGVSSISSKLFSIVNTFFNARMFANTLGNSISNISAHYDISNKMFAAFLSPDMTYSCGIFEDLDGDITRAIGSDGLERFGPDGERINGSHAPNELKKAVTLEWKNDEGLDELEEAQMTKLRYIIKKAKIQKGHRILEIGSGWGSLAIEAVRSTGCIVDTLTLSIQQAVLARQRIEAAGLTDSITVHLLDYRAIPKEWEGAFDRVISIEMIEAVGKEFMNDYFEVINRALNANGAAVIQAITIPESRFEAYQRDVDFIRKWIFPGGFLPTWTFMTNSIHKGTNARMVVDDVANIGPHYARTLREWCTRFQAAFPGEITRSLLEEHPEMDAQDIETFRRKWIYYFVYCDAGFSERVLGVHIFRITKEGNRPLGCDVFA